MIGLDSSFLGQNIMIREIIDNSSSDNLLYHDWKISDLMITLLRKLHGVKPNYSLYAC